MFVQAPLPSAAQQGARLPTHAKKSCVPQAVEQKRKAEDISSVLYPNDATEYGKELRLKQQFFFVSASIQVSLSPMQPLLASRVTGKCPVIELWYLMQFH